MAREARCFPGFFFFAPNSGYPVSRRQSSWRAHGPSGCKERKTDAAPWNAKAAKAAKKSMLSRPGHRTPRQVHMNVTQLSRDWWAVLVAALAAVLVKLGLVAGIPW